MKKLQLLILFLFFVFLGFASDIRTIPIHNIGLKNGLSNGFVNDIVMDGQGFLWVATESGLTRIAGNKCTTFKTSNSNIHSNDNVGVFYDKHTDKLWIHFKDGKANIYDCKTQTFSDATNLPGMYDKSIADISAASDGGLWIAFYDGTVQHYDNRKGVFHTIAKSYFPHCKNGVRCIAEDDKGHLFIGMRMDGMYVFHLKTSKVEYFHPCSHNASCLPGGNVRSVFVDHLQNVWVGTNKGLALFDISSGKFHSFPHIPQDIHSPVSDNIHQVTETADHTLWVCSDIGGISQLKIDTHTATAKNLSFTQLTRQNTNLSSNNIRRVVEDDFGNIWVANYSTGIDFIPKEDVEFHTLKYNGLPIESVIGIYCDRQNRLWTGQDNTISCIKDGIVVGSWNFSSCIANSSASVYCFQEDRSGNFWFGTSDNGVLCFNPTLSTFRHLHNASSLDVHAICEDSNGKIWIGSEAGIFSVVDGKENKEERINNLMGKQSSTCIYAIVEDHYGQLWIGTLGKGIFVFDRNKNLKAHLNRENVLNSNSVNQIIFDEKGGIWIGAFNGLTYVPDPRHPNRVHHYDELQGLKEPHIRALCQDRKGNIWVSMFSGIACFDVKRQKFYDFDWQSGIPVGNFVEASVAVMQDGTVYFGSPSGICFFNPQLISASKTISPVEIIDCERIGKQRDGFVNTIINPRENGDIQLNYDDNTFKIVFTIRDFAQEGDVEYAYMMQGLDDQWYATEGDNEVTFRNLGAGHYTFKIRARLKNQEWNEASMAELSLNVNPPLWLTGWAKILYALLILSVIWYLFRIYKRSLALRFFTNITHEIRTPLTLIIGPLEDLLENQQLPEAAHSKLTAIHANAERLLCLVNDILDFRKVQNNKRRLAVAFADVGVLVNEMGMRFTDLNRNPHLSIHVNVASELPLLYFDSEVVTTVINNFMSNAIKYTPAGDITLSAKLLMGKYVEIAVEDTGYGMDKSALSHIYERYYQINNRNQATGTGIGLALVKSLATLHEAKLNVASEKGKGSRFAILLEIDNTYPSALHKENAAERNKSIDKSVTMPLLPSILIVEDNADIRQYIEDSIHKDYRILQAADGKAGLQKAVEEIPDLIVSDIMMPQMDGITMMRKLKGDIRTSHIPVILLTAKTDIEDQLTGYDSGADSYLTKPFSAKLLQSRIRNILTSRKRLAAFIAGKNLSDQSASEHDPEYKLNQLDQEFLDKLNGLIEQYITTRDLDMAFMTDKMAMSHSTFYRKVKALTGMSANEYIRKAKLRKSMQLLKTKQYNVTEVAMMTGFNNMGNFRESFKREFGITPSELLKK